MAIQQFHTIWQQVRNLQCHIYMFYFFRVLYVNLQRKIETKTLNVRHQAQKGFRGIFFGIPEHKKLYLVYVPSKRKIISSYDVVFDESFSSALLYTSRPYSEAMAMHPAVTYTPYATSSREETGDVITFAQF